MRFLLLATALTLVISGASFANKNTTARKAFVSRADSFFGLHFDLHANEDDTSLGADITEDMLDRLIDRVHPDYMQYDCKGHRGYTGYPTKLGNACPGIVKDSLAIWRKVTREHGVGLFIHYSGVWDKLAIQKHPEWAAIGSDGKPNELSTSNFGPYVDELMIPQLKEVTSAYQLDGVWVDGDCWGTALDYSPAALAAWKAETGLDQAPKSRDEPHWLEWKMFHRRQFEKYLCHWVDALHAYNPKLQITSNWMYTTFDPKPVTANLDYMSGDFFPINSLDSARLEGRYMENVGLPWDLMSWGFSSDDHGYCLKPAVQIEQEASVVLMLGGGFQIYNIPTRAGYINDTVIDTAAKVADFCRARQKVSHKSTSIPQVALLYSSETYFDRSDNVLSSQGGSLDDISGALQALLELHYSVDVLAEYQLQPRLKEFPVVVIPDAYKLTDEFKSALVNYVKDGGALVLLGQKCAHLFGSELGVEYVGDPRNVPAVVASPSGAISENGVWQSVKVLTASAVGYRYPTSDVRKDGEVAATVAKCGKGRIAAIYGPVALDFFNTRHPYLRQFIGSVVKRVFPNPAVQVDGLPCIDVALRNTKDGKLSVHLLNTASASRSEKYVAVDYIPPVGPVGVKVNVPKKPSAVKWIPDGGKLDWSWSSGVLSVTIPTVRIHGVLVIEEKV
ncbi:MAG: alpha-amylase family protein [Armatimonadota bacterium]